jgi:diguanylate cyclase (GGDEF)-like protein
MGSASTSNFGSHGWMSPNAGSDMPSSGADTLLHEELPSWIDRLSEEVLSVYAATEMGKADGGLPMREAARAYLSALAESDLEARAASRARMAVLYARAGLDLSAHFELSARAFALLAERAAFRFRQEPGRLAGALIEVQRRLWEDARVVTDTFVHARERHLGQLVKQLSVVRRDLVRRAHDDPLTGVRNRAYALESLSAELDRARRYGEPFSLLFADLDHFKSMNDTHGHEAGDEVLQLVATLFRRELRPQDIVGRYGGDEFVVGLVRANAPTAHQVAERLRASVDAAHLQARDGSPRVTLSIGVVTVSSGSETVVELIRKADTAMYAAKAAGRNQVRIAPSS